MSVKYICRGLSHSPVPFKDKDIHFVGQIATISWGALLDCSHDGARGQFLEGVCIHYLLITPVQTVCTLKQTFSWLQCYPEVPHSYLQASQEPAVP